ncbi:MAG TPA: hypothetical protein VK666_00355 [Chryseolinea sp.]|nr:hypothetical protein [Chryseolinea sp.]
MFSTRQQAIDALVEARVKYTYRQGNGPISVYQCEECGTFHLTSQGTVDETLRKQITDGKIALQKEANHWLNKLDKH